MFLIFSVIFAFVTCFATPHLFDHATKNYTDYLTNQSPEKAKIAQTIANAAKIIKEIEQTEKKDSENEHEVECDEKTFDEFRLICPKNGSPLLEKINPKTAIGLTHLIKLLAQPTIDTEELKKRQKIIRFFIEHPDITAKIQDLVGDLQKEEAFLLNPTLRTLFLQNYETELKKIKTKDNSFPDEDDTVKVSISANNDKN